MYKTIIVGLAASLALAFTLPSQAAIIYATPASNYPQNFDALPNTPQNTSLGNSPVGWTDDNASPGAGNFSIVGWYLYHPLAVTEGGFSGGTTGNHRMRIGAGTANTGAFMSFGASSSSERALGMVNSNTLSTATPSATDTAYLGARFTNNTGVTLTQFTVSYNGEQWRDGGAATPVAQSILFAYKVTSGAANLQDGGFTGEPTLNFISSVFANTGSGASVDGNVAGKTAIGPITVTGLSWAPGDDLWIRWADLNDVGNDHGLGIDDLSFSADAVEVPEPSSVALMCLAVLCVRWRDGRVSLTMNRS